jgi:hypothetical protein
MLSWPCGRLPQVVGLQERFAASLCVLSARLGLDFEQARHWHAKGTRPEEVPHRCVSQVRDKTSCA